jgi:hypothetical protein
MTLKILSRDEVSQYDRDSNWKLYSFTVWF